MRLNLATGAWTLTRRREAYMGRPAKPAAARARLSSFVRARVALEAPLMAEISLGAEQSSYDSVVGRSYQFLPNEVL
ncbi:unnamed protein product [Trichogramma brassicae]|uniref:Uncharacterized protein n=1 Tax=Trichogramma brassicae TaxID=86971 RepID=A0A6H5IEK5_9HYME|nr:unnamed protein product [Trichogramma brassicae]